MHTHKYNYTMKIRKGEVYCSCPILFMLICDLFLSNREAIGQLNVRKAPRVRKLPRQYMEWNTYLPLGHTAHRLARNPVKTLAPH